MIGVDRQVVHGGQVFATGHSTMRATIVGRDRTHRSRITFASTRIIESSSANQLHVLVGRAMPFDLSRSNRASKRSRCCFLIGTGLPESPHHLRSMSKTTLVPGSNAQSVPDVLRNGDLPFTGDSSRHVRPPGITSIYHCNTDVANANRKSKGPPEGGPFSSLN